MSGERGELGGGGVVVNSSLVTGDPEQHGELGGGGVVVNSSLVTARRCPAPLEFQLDPQDHEKVKWPPLLAM